MKFDPLHDRVAVKRSDDVASQTAGGIIIPENAKEKPQEGEVVAVGAGKYENGELRRLTVYIGARVLFGKYAGADITIDGQELLIMRDEEILGILRDD